MRRLPVFMLIDVSESMVGEPLRQMEAGLERIVATLRQDPHSLETVYLSLIAFAGKARAITPLIDLVSFYLPKIPVGGGTALGAALDVLMSEIDEQVVPSTASRRGDWKPVVFLLTDGKPTDHPAASVARWKQHYADRCTLIAVTLGNNADRHLLRQLTDQVLALEHASDAQFNQFIEWVSASVRAQSQRVELNKTGGISLEKAEESGLTLVETDEGSVSDPDYVVLTGKCSSTGLPYLIKYQRNRVKQNHALDVIQPVTFTLEGAFALDNSYFDWSSESAASEPVNTAHLDGAPPCPHCGNIIGFAVCECDHLLCLDMTGIVTCPWCQKEQHFNMEVGGGANFEVARGQG